MNADIDALRRSPTEVWSGGHRRCLGCGRLLVPTMEGWVPRHRIPPKGLSGRTGAVPLTGTGSPWCESRHFA